MFNSVGNSLALSFGNWTIPVAADAWRRRVAPLLALALGAWWCGPTYALDIVAIEEHWELEIGEPDAGSSSPQVCMVMSPNGDLEGDFFVFTLNHHTEPAFAPGGLQVQQWSGEALVESRPGPQETTLHVEGESVQWVQRLSVEDESLQFEVKSGQSSSWGSFGDAGHLRITAPTALATLNGYRPAVSLQESGTSFAGNRVRSLTLRKLRWWDSAGNVYELNAPIDIDADLDP
jgi:hypothetical protein